MYLLLPDLYQTCVHNYYGIIVVFYTRTSRKEVAATIDRVERDWVIHMMFYNEVYVVALGPSGNLLHTS